jgi:hypothetical protein
MSSLKILLKEFRYLQECAKDGGMVAPCRVSFDETNMWVWNLSFDLVADGAVIETADFMVKFPTDYPFSSPVVIALNPDYKFRFCLKEGWAAFPCIPSIIAHIYLTITDLDYYQNRGRYVPKSAPPLPSPENKEKKD